MMLNLSRRLMMFGGAATFARCKFAMAEDQPWQAQFVAGSFDGVKYQAGLHIVLKPNWKTYWRVPGSGGIPPSITLSGANLKSFSFDCPMPKRFHGEEGETIGYKDEVLFPIAVEPQDVSLPVDVNASAFIGVCDTICIPVPIEQIMQFQPVSASQPADALIRNWQMRVPYLASETVVSSATLVENSLVVQLAKPIDDIFVEGPTLLSFDAPIIAGNTATLAVHGMKSATDLVGKNLKLTLTLGSTGLEQSVIVV